jgi:hypothetical protein
MTQQASSIQWYLTRYAELTNGQFELLTYDKMPSLEVAQLRAKTKLPNNEFYEVECRVGSLLPKVAKPTWVAREMYSHKPDLAQQQVEAELKAQRLLKKICTKDSFNLKIMMTNIINLKPLLIQAQYQLLLDALMTKPCIMKTLYVKENR